jgi:hypothetical protein
MDPAALEERLVLLERRAGRLRVLGLMATALAAATPAWLLLAGDAPLQEGQLWMARDGAGRVRAMLGITADGVGLTMYDSSGQMRLDLGLAPGGIPGLVLLSPRGEPVATLNLNQQGVPTLRLSDFVRRTRLDLGPGGDHPPVVASPTEPPDTLIARGPRR